MCGRIKRLAGKQLNFVVRIKTPPEEKEKMKDLKKYQRSKKYSQIRKKTGPKRFEKPDEADEFFKSYP